MREPTQPSEPVRTAHRVMIAVGQPPEQTSITPRVTANSRAQSLPGGVIRSRSFGTDVQSGPQSLASASSVASESQRSQTLETRPVGVLVPKRGPPTANLSARRCRRLLGLLAFSRSNPKTPLSQDGGTLAHPAKGCQPFRRSVTYDRDGCPSADQSPTVIIDRLNPARQIALTTANSERQHCRNKPDKRCEHQRIQGRLVTFGDNVSAISPEIANAPHAPSAASPPASAVNSSRRPPRPWRTKNASPSAMATARTACHPTQRHQPARPAAGAGRIADASDHRDQNSH